MPSGASSNADAIAAMLIALPDGIRFDSEIGNRSLGRDMAKACATGIDERSRGDQTDPSGEGWPANQGKYGEKKQQAGLPVGYGLKSGQFGNRMLSLVELQGIIEVTEEGRMLHVRYGTSDEARRKGDWFTNGSTGDDGEPSGAKNQPPRKFYGLDDTIRAELKKLAGDHLKRVIAELRSL